MERSPTLLDLAGSIHSKVRDFHQQLNDAGIPLPRHDDVDSPLLQLDDGQEELRLSLLDEVNRLRDLLTTPYEVIHAQNTSHMVALHAIYRYRVAQAIPVGERRSFSEISQASGMPVKLCRRLLRTASLSGIFREAEQGLIQHSPASKLIATNPHMHEYIGAQCEEVWPSATKVIESQREWPGSDQPEQSGFFLAHRKPLYEVLDSEPARRARYDSAMQAFLGDRMFRVEHLASAYDWTALGDATVVDVGGGRGQISLGLAKQFPRLSFVVQDLPSVIGEAGVHRQEDDVGMDLGTRVNFQEHDFFEPQPVRGAAVYFFKSVCIDWSNDKVVQILRALTPALKPGAVVLIQEPFSPEPNTVPTVVERRLRTTDMLALALENGGNRDLDEWKSIFQEAGQGFSLKTARFIKGSPTALIEAIWTG